MKHLDIRMNADVVIHHSASLTERNTYIGCSSAHTVHAEQPKHYDRFGSCHLLRSLHLPLSLTSQHVDHLRFQTLTCDAVAA